MNAGQLHRYDLGSNANSNAEMRPTLLLPALGGISSSLVLMYVCCISRLRTPGSSIISSRTLSEPQPVLAMKWCPGRTGSRRMADCRCYLCNPGSISAPIPIDRATESNLYVRLLLRLEVRVSSLVSKFSIHVFEPTPAEITPDSI